MTASYEAKGVAFSIQVEQIQEISPSSTGKICEERVGEGEVGGGRWRWGGQERGREGMKERMDRAGGEREGVPKVFAHNILLFFFFLLISQTHKIVTFSVNIPSCFPLATKLSWTERS